MKKLDFCLLQYMGLDVLRFQDTKIERENTFT
jgi:hypothetical protein